MVEINESITFKQKFEEGIGITHELFYLGEENLWQKKQTNKTKQWVSKCSMIGMCLLG